MTILDDAAFTELLRLRAETPEAVADRAARRLRRPLLVGDKRLLIVAVDHPARSILGVGDDPWAMADRRRLLTHTIRALRRPGVDGVLASPDILEDLLLLGELETRVVLGSMNRGGLTGTVWELDDRFTGHDAATIERLGFEGGKMLLRIDPTDPGTLATIESCAAAVTALASRRLIAMVEPLPAFRDRDGMVRVTTDPDALVRAVSVASALGATSAYTWLKLPAAADPGRMLDATTLPVLLLGGDPGGDVEGLVGSWARAMAFPQVRGLVAGRSLVFPVDGDVERWVDTAVEIVHGP
ncbi:MAG: Cgl0159 family (beta/alpha)8-fold protein [Acidimicrobiia bacterium]